MFLYDHRCYYESSKKLTRFSILSRGSPNHYQTKNHEELLASESSFVIPKPIVLYVLHDILHTPVFHMLATTSNIHVSTEGINI